MFSLFPVIRYLKIPVFSLFCSLISIASAQTKTLGLTKKINGNDENGYVLFAPIGTDTTYLMNKCGQKLHTWNTHYTPGLSVYLKPNGNLIKSGIYDDTTFGMAGGRGGIIEEYGWNGNLVWSYKLFNDSLCQHHDILPMSNGNVLVLAWHSISKSEAINLGRNTANFLSAIPELWGERIIELKPLGSDSAEIVWQWDLFDHIIQDEDTSYPNFGMVNQHPELVNINYALNLKTNDWVHANGIDYNEDLDQIVISAHNFSEFWIIDHSTSKAEAATHNGGTYDKGGDLLYRWGNPEAYGNGTSNDRKLFRQHNVHWIKDGLRNAGSIILFNNGWNRDTAYSTVEIITPPILPNGSYVANLPFGPNVPTWLYKDSIPKNFYSQIISGAEMLPNGNVLICSGVQGRFFEVTAAKKIVWEYRNPVNGIGVQSDGEKAGNNAVFRCSYYGKGYGAFSNRTLNAMGTVEQNSFPYSCTYETVPPKVVSLTPLKNAVSIGLNNTLTVTFDEAVLKRSGDISIFQNNSLLESININSDLVHVKNNVVSINHSRSFDVNAHIAISVPKTLFRDSSNNYLSKGIDTSEWHFNTITSRPTITTISPAHSSVSNKANARLVLKFNQKVFKDKGAITLYENGQPIETIAVNSSQVTLTGNTVLVQPNANFNSNKLIVVTMDSCFRDSFGTLCSDIAYGNWYFRTANLPAMVSSSPVNNAKNILQSSSLSFELDKEVMLDSIKQIQIYENGSLKTSVSTNSASLQVNGKTITILHNQTFAKGSRIAIRFPANALLDTFGYRFAGIDTSSWHFTVEKASSIKSSTADAGIEIYPVPSNGIVNVKASIRIEKIEIFTMDGKQVLVPMVLNEENTMTIDLSEHVSGTYVVLINGKYRQMIVVQ